MTSTTTSLWFLYKLFFWILFCFWNFFVYPLQIDDLNNKLCQIRALRRTQLGKSMWRDHRKWIPYSEIRGRAPGHELCYIFSMYADRRGMNMLYFEYVGTWIVLYFSMYAERRDVSYVIFSMYAERRDVSYVIFSMYAERRGVSYVIFSMYAERRDMNMLYFRADVGVS